MKDMSSKFSDSPEYQKLLKEWNEKINKVPMNNRIGRKDPDLFEGSKKIPEILKELDKEDV
jgi:hypothetical protein